ncbi:molybdenum cofactor guanylyltransferase [Parasphingorhabdus pacifica]
MLGRTLDVVASAREIVVVGPRREVPTEVHWACEDPPGGGPLAGIQAGLQRVSTESGLVVVLAADHPWLTTDTVSRLLAAAVGEKTAERDQASFGAVLVDRDDRAQWLVGAWRIEALRDVMPAEATNRPVRRLLAALEPVRVPAVDAEAVDVDTPEELRAARGKL